MSLEKLQLPFGPGNKQLMSKIPIVKKIGDGSGDPLKIGEIFEPPKPVEVIPAAPPTAANPEKDKQGEAFRARLRRARLAQIDDEAPLSTSLG